MSLARDHLLDFLYREARLLDDGRSLVRRQAFAHAGAVARGLALAQHAPVEAPPIGAAVAHQREGPAGEVPGRDVPVLHRQHARSVTQQQRRRATVAEREALRTQCHRAAVQVR